MKITYPTEIPNVALTDEEFRGLRSNDLSFRLHFGERVREMTLTSDNDPAKVAEGRVVLNETRYTELNNSRVAYFPLGMNIGFHLSLPPRPK